MRRSICRGARAHGHGRRLFFKGWDVACKYLSYVVQERHEEDAREVGFGELVVQKIRHQRHAPTVLGDTLLSSGFHPSVARTLLEACDDVQDGQIIGWGHSCSFVMITVLL